jgi:hypothetical protein
MQESYRAFWQFLVIALFAGFLYLIVKLGEEGAKMFLGLLWIFFIVTSLGSCVWDIARRL